MLCIWVTPHDRSAAFYLLPTRAWEMLFGGVIYLFPIEASENRWKNQIVQLAGLLIILAGILLTDPAAPWPGWRALVPVLGTALAMGSTYPESRLLNNAPAQWIGKTSYSIYLWHWPVVVALGFFELSNRIEWRIGGILLSALLGGLSFYAVEQTTRRIGREKRGLPASHAATLTALMKIGASTLPIALLALFVWRSDGYAPRAPVSVRIVKRARSTLTFR